jgi:hypothetical protein
MCSPCRGRILIERDSGVKVAAEEKALLQDATAIAAKELRSELHPGAFERRCLQLLPAAGCAH